MQQVFVSSVSLQQRVSSPVAAAPGRRFAAVVCAGLLSLSACSDARIDALEESTKADIRDLRSLQADQTATLNQIRTEISTLRGQVEELQYVSTGKTRELEQTLQRLNTRVPPPPGVPEELLSRDEERIASISGPAADKFKNGLRQLRGGDFEGARVSFSEFSQENPGTAFTDNALFWTGIAMAKMGQYDRAVLSFTEVFTTYPAEDMVPPALFFLAENLEKTGARADAQEALRKLIDEHPSSAYAAQARTKVKGPARRAPSRGRR